MKSSVKLTEWSSLWGVLCWSILVDSGSRSSEHESSHFHVDLYPVLSVLRFWGPRATTSVTTVALFAFFYAFSIEWLRACSSKIWKLRGNERKRFKKRFWVKLNERNFFVFFANKKNTFISVELYMTTTDLWCAPRVRGPHKFTLI